jgi:hypothetical protein
MSINVRKLTLIAVSLAPLLVAQSAQTSIGTDLGYGSGWLSGYSSTYVAPDSDWQCTDTDWAYLSGYGWVEVCIEAEAWANGSGVQGYLTPPSSSTYFYDEAFTQWGEAWIEYGLQSPSSGSWQAWADHFESVFHYSGCRVTYQGFPPAPYVYPSDCNYDGAEFTYAWIGQTDDSATVP